MAQLIFRCPRTKEDFDSGFQAGSSEMKLLPAGAKIRVRCKVCGDLHEFKFADARLKDQAAPRRRR